MQFVTTRPIPSETAILFEAAGREVELRLRPSHFPLDKSSGVLEYYDEDLFDDPGGEDFDYWNRYTSSLDAG